MAQSGYDQDRFVTAPSDVFECIICSLIVIEPYECHHCGKLYCKGCIADWGKKNGAQKCPNRCESTITPIFSKALQRMYLSLDIKCSNNKCKKAVKLIDLAKHEENCLKIKCWNYQACEQPQNDKLKFGQPCCSVLCSAVLDLVNNFGNNKKMYEILGQFCKSPVIINPINPINPTVSSGGSNWDPAKCGTGIELTEGNAMCFLKEQSYLFRTVLGVTGYTSGIHYWEIYADIRTENELKIGVATSKDFDFNSAFCDHPFGYAYYGTNLAYSQDLDSSDRIQMPQVHLTAKDSKRKESLGSA